MIASCDENDDGFQINNEVSFNNSDNDENEDVDDDDDMWEFKEDLHWVSMLLRLYACSVPNSILIPTKKSKSFNAASSV